MLKEFECAYPVYVLQLQVVAIKLKDSHLLDDISDQRCIVGAESSPSIGPIDSQADIYSNHYYDDPCSEVTRGNVHGGRKVNDYSMLVDLIVWQFIIQGLSSRVPRYYILVSVPICNAWCIVCTFSLPVSFTMQFFRLQNASITFPLYHTVYNNYHHPYT